MRVQRDCVNENQPNPETLLTWTASERNQRIRNPISKISFKPCLIYVPYMICLKHMNNKLNTGKGTLTFKHNTLPKYADIWNFLQSTLKSFGLLNKFTLGQAWLCIFKNNMVGDAVSCNGNWGCGSCPVCFGGTLGNHNRTFLKLHSIQTLRYCVHLSSILHLSV